MKAKLIAFVLRIFYKHHAPLSAFEFMARLASVIILLSIVISSLQIVPVHAASLILNGGFESGVGPDAEGWIEGEGHVRSNDVSHRGSWSLASTYTGASSATSTGDLGDLGENFVVYVSYWAIRVNSDGSAYLLIHGDAWEGQSFPTISDAVGWQHITGSVLAEDASSFYVDLVTENMTAAVYFDDVCVSTNETDCTDPTWTPSNTPTNTATQTPTPTDTATFTPTVTFTPTPTDTPTATFTPTNTPTLMAPAKLTATYARAVVVYTQIAANNNPTVIILLIIIGIIVMVIFVFVALAIAKKLR